MTSPPRPAGRPATALVLASLAVALVAGCDGHDSTSPPTGLSQASPTTADAGAVNDSDVPSTAPPQVEAATIAGALRAAGVAVCDDAAAGTSGDVETHAASAHHFRFGTDAAGGCDSAGVGRMTISDYSDPTSAQHAVSIDATHTSYVLGYRCGLHVVTVDDTTPGAVRTRVESVLRTVPGCAQVLSHP